MKLQKRNRDTNLNYFSLDKFTELIVSFILFVLYMHMHKYELRFYLLINFSVFQILYV